MPEQEQQMNALFNVSKTKHVEKILWMHGANDIDTPPDMGRRFEEQCNTESDMWIVPNGEHAKCYDKAPEEYFSKMLLLFNSTLCV